MFYFRLKKFDEKLKIWLLMLIKTFDLNKVVVVIVPLSNSWHKNISFLYKCQGPREIEQPKNLNLNLNHSRDFDLIIF
jgi:hypothetical protein